jgi:Mrp family chromosome partitioning ATPase
LLLDSSPLLITNEGRALVKLAGQVVMVVRAGHTPRHAVEEALSLFDSEKSGGLILNQVTSRGSHGLYGYDTYGIYGDNGVDAKKS